MQNLTYLLLFSLISTFSLNAQEFSNRKTLIENLETPISGNGIITVEDLVYCTSIEEGKTNFISHIDSELVLYEYSDGITTTLDSLGPLSAFIVDVYDHNRDGNIDILGHFQILLNEGNSTFGESSSPINGSSKGRINRAIDFNNDGIRDIVTKGVVFSGGSSEETIYIYILNENSEIEKTITFVSDEDILCTQVFDLNADGFSDVVYTLDIFGDNRIIIQMNNGDDTFTEQDLGVSNTGSLILAEDFDNDSDLDIIITGFNGKDIEIIENIEGVFEDDKQIIDADRVYSMHHSDFNNDGNIDLAYIENENFDSLNTLVALGLGDGTFKEPVSIGKVAYNGTSFGSLEQAAENWMTVYDYDQDGDDDILVNAALEQKYVAFDNLLISTSTVNIENNDAPILFPNPTYHFLNFETELIPTHIEVSDVNGMLKNTWVVDNGTIDVSHLTSGIYFLKLINQEGQFSISRFIKN